MRLIDADALAKFIDYGHLNNPDEKLFSENDIREMIDMMPVFNVVLDFQAETPKHGHWVNNGFEPVRCSVCGITVDAINGIPWAIKSFNYCPHCGAKMDEVLNAPLRNGKSMMELERLMDEVTDGT